MIFVHNYTFVISLFLGRYSPKLLSIVGSSGIVQYSFIHQKFVTIIEITDPLARRYLLCMYGNGYSCATVNNNRIVLDFKFGYFD